MTESLQEFIEIAKHPVIQALRDRKWMVGDMFVYAPHPTMLHFVTDLSPSNIWDDRGVIWVKEDILFLPKLSDPLNPERGLWANVEWEKTAIDGRYKDGTITLVRDDYPILFRGTPEIACCKAIIWQSEHK